jgi:hypothetical protein
VIIYRPDKQLSVKIEDSLEEIKVFCDSNALFSDDSYSELIAEGIQVLMKILKQWFQNAIEARENSISYFREAKEITLEGIL